VNVVQAPLKADARPEEALDYNENIIKLNALVEEINHLIDEEGQQSEQRAAKTTPATTLPREYLDLMQPLRRVQRVRRKSATPRRKRSSDMCVGPACEEKPECVGDDCLREAPPSCVGPQCAEDDALCVGPLCNDERRKRSAEMPPSCVGPQCVEVETLCVGPMCENERKKRSAKPPCSGPECIEANDEDCADGDEECRNERVMKLALDKSDNLLLRRSNDLSPAWNQTA